MRRWDPGFKWKCDVVLAAHDVALWVGKRGSGKSTRLKMALAKAMEAGQRVLMFDPLDEYSQRGKPSEAVVLGPLAQRMTVTELAEDLDALNRDDLALAVVPDSDEPDEWAADFVALLVEAKHAGNLILGADELAVWGERAIKEINKAACLSRHWGVALALASQRATGIPFTARKLATQINSGKQDDPEDVDALRKRVGPALADEISALKRGEFRHWRDSD